jgi:hypothetical protein
MIIRRTLKIDIMKSFMHYIIFWINPEYQPPQKILKTRKGMDWTMILTEHDLDIKISKLASYRSDRKEPTNAIIRKIFENICSNRIS